MYTVLSIPPLFIYLHEHPRKHDARNSYPHLSFRHHGVGAVALFDVPTGRDAKAVPLLIDTSGTTRGVDAAAPPSFAAPGVC